MKRLSALVIGVFMVVSAQSVFGMSGYSDPLQQAQSGIAAAQNWGQDKVQNTNCRDELTGVHSQGDAANEPKIESVCYFVSDSKETVYDRVQFGIGNGN